LELRSGPGETSRQVVERVHRARQRQLERPKQQGGGPRQRGDHRQIRPAGRSGAAWGDTGLPAGAGMTFNPPLLPCDILFPRSS
jgi:hypothetical protein